MAEGYDEDHSNDRFETCISNVTKWDHLASHIELMREDFLKVHEKTAYYDTTDLDMPRLDSAQIYGCTNQTPMRICRMRYQMRCLTSRETSGVVTNPVAAAMKLVAMLKKTLMSKCAQTG